MLPALRARATPSISNMMIIINMHDPFLQIKALS